MSEWETLVESIVTTVVDYVENPFNPPPGREEVERWIEQFGADVRVPLLRELSYVLGKTYFSRDRIKAFLTEMVTDPKIVGGEPEPFWRGTSFLNIQLAGGSQRDMLTIFSEVLNEVLGLSIEKCGGPRPSRYCYLDDVVYTGTRVRQDLTQFVKELPAQTDEVHIVSLFAYHGAYYNHQQLEQAAAATGKDIQFRWWPRDNLRLENRNKYRNKSDVLWPARLPDDPAVQVYVRELRYTDLRTSPGIGGAEIFSGESGRDLLEQEFLKAGVRIRSLSPQFPETHRPLGFSSLSSFGFGNMIVTYRNCPNTAPLALWAGPPWHPLFPRVNNIPRRLRA